MGFLSGFLGSEKNTDKVVDTAADLIQSAKNGIDMLVYTEEEKAIAGREAITRINETVVKLHEKTHDENSERSKARRDLANKITDLVVHLVYFSVMTETFKLAGWLKESLTNQIIAIATALSVGWAFVAVICFYFGYYGGQKIAQTIKKQ